MNIPEEDRQVLQQLAEHGDDPSIVRPVVHWLFGDEADLRELGRRLSDRGWADTEPSQDGDLWLMSPAKRSDLSAEAIVGMNNDINEVSRGLNITHDGWETSVEQPN
jgi:regulator of RNase E activity RraB